MDRLTEQLSFSAIKKKKIATHERQNQKVNTAVTDYILRSESLALIHSDEEKMRLARECVKIFTENFLATVKYQLPGALIEYLEWLRGFLRNRDFPRSFIPLMLAGMRNAVHAFLENYNSDDICAALREIRNHEQGIASEVTS